MKRNAIILAVVLATIIFLIGRVRGSPSNWTEVTRFTGSGSETYTTTYFNCAYVEWRIKWAYTPDPTYPTYAMFGLFAYPKGEDISYISSVIKTGASDTSGTTYIHGNQGILYCKITVANTQNYAIIIEQDIDSVPEFPLGPVFVLLTATLFIAILARRGLSLTVDGLPKNTDIRKKRV